MAFIVAGYDWNTGDTITAARLDSNVTAYVTGLNSGTKTINISDLQIGSTSFINTSLELENVTKATVDNVVINGNDISSTSGNLTLTPVAGSNITLDGTITVDAGVIAGATSITSTAFVGDITGDITGNADTATALETARTIGGTSFDGTANITVASATGGFAVSGGNLTLGTNDITGVGTVTATTLGGTLSTAAQGNVTSLGTLTTLTVDDITINGNTISSAGASTLAINPEVGQSITFDGTIQLDAGVITGATSITSTAFVGDITGDVTGNVSGTAATVTGATQAAITTCANLVTVGALDSGSITSGFTSIDTGSGAISGGIITGSTLTDGTASIISGAISGVTTLAMSSNITMSGGASRIQISSTNSSATLGDLKLANSSALGAWIQLEDEAIQAWYIGIKNGVDAISFQANNKIAGTSEALRVDDSGITTIGGVFSGAISGVTSLNATGQITTTSTSSSGGFHIDSASNAYMVIDGGAVNEKHLDFKNLGSTIWELYSRNTDVLAFRHGVSTEYMKLDPVLGAIVINENSADLDFRVETNGNANAFVLDGGNDTCSVGVDTTFGADLRMANSSGWFGLGQLDTGGVLSGGVATITGSYATITSEAGAADDCNTITGTGAIEGDVAILVPASGDTITFKDGTGNLKLTGDHALASVNDRLVVQFNGANWCQISVSING